jgi:DNA-binding transcriptional regulator YdaS (Cro superfamily)
MSLLQFGKLAGVSSGYLSDIVTGRRPPGRQIAVRIMNATGGVVTLVDLLTWPTTKRRKKAKSPAVDLPKDPSP